jgi:predicted esterase
LRKTHIALARLLCVLACASHSAVADSTLSGRSGLQTHVVFSEYTPLARSEELVRRLLSPLQADRLQQQLIGAGRMLRDQPIELADESFTIYVPTQPSESGYALLVFLPPWENAVVPLGWQHVLDRHHMIFVSADRSGNDEDISKRREPLTILAAVNVMAHYRIDADHVYVGGFSGGSRVALRVAVAYPDLFRGALLNAGSDAIGNSTFPLPPSDLFARFQESSELVYLTGENDEASVGNDADSIASMRKWCVFGVHAEALPHTGHSPATPDELDRALNTLSRHALSDPERLRSCRQHVEQARMQLLGQVDRSLASGSLRNAQGLIQDIDVQYGGLSAPEINTLQRQLEELLKKARSGDVPAKAE